MLLNCGVGEDSWESLGLQGDPTSQSEWNQSWIFFGRIDAEAEAPILWPPDAKSWLIGKDPDAGKDWRQEEKGMSEDKMVRLHHRLNGHESEQILGNCEGQGSLVCFSPWGLKESDTTQQLNNTTLCLIWLAVYLETAPFILDKQDGLGCNQQGKSRVCCTSCRQWAMVLKTWWNSHRLPSIQCLLKCWKEY